MSATYDAIMGVSGAGSNWAALLRRKREAEQAERQFEKEMRLKEKEFSLKDLLTKADLKKQQEEQDWISKVRTYMLTGRY